MKSDSHLVHNALVVSFELRAKPAQLHTIEKIDKNPVVAIPLEGGGQ